MSLLKGLGISILFFPIQLSFEGESVIVRMNDYNLSIWVFRAIQFRRLDSLISHISRQQMVPGRKIEYALISLSLSVVGN
jgi:hypothetical protein